MAHQKTLWSAVEIVALLEGIAKHGKRWKTIKNDVQFHNILNGRDRQMCKNKFRNIIDAQAKEVGDQLTKQLQNIRVPRGVFAIGPTVGGPPAFRDWPEDRTNALKNGVTKYKVVKRETWIKIKTDNEFQLHFVGVSVAQMSRKWDFFQDEEAAGIAILLLQWMRDDLLLQQQHQQEQVGFALDAPPVEDEEQGLGPEVPVAGDAIPEIGPSEQELAVGITAAPAKVQGGSSGHSATFYGGDDF